MTLNLTTLKNSGRAALFALTLGTVGMTAMPVQAQPSLNFQLGIGNDGGVMGFELNGNNKKRFRPIRDCLTDRQVERGLEWYGFDDADVVRRINRRSVLVIAEWNNRYYSMRVNKCSGEVSNVKRLRRGQDFFDGPGKGPKGGFGYEKDGFSFQFNF